MRIIRLLAAPLLVLSACDSQSAQLFGDGQELTKSSEREVLAPGKWVTDAAGIIEDDLEAGMTQQLQDLERLTGHQMVVVTVPTLDGEAIEDYSLRLANEWGVGRRKHNDGILMLVAPNEREARIEVGLGLEDVVTNSFASDVLETDMLPQFREGDYGGGVSAGMATLISRLTAPQA